MPGKILGIDISEYNISAVQVISGLKGYQMVSCFSTPVTDHNLEKALEDLAGRFDLKSDKCLLTIPVSDISFRNINTPFKDPKKIRQTLPFEIETLVPFAVDDRVMDYIHTDTDNPESILTAAIKKDYIGGYIEQLKNAGVDPDIIDIRPVPAVIWLLDQESTPDNGIYIDLEPENPCVVIFQNRKIVLIRELPCSFSESPGDGDNEENEHSLTEPIENIINTICRETDRTVYSFNSITRDGFKLEKLFFGGRLSSYNSTAEILDNFFEKSAERIHISRDSRIKMDPGVPGIYESVLMDHALAVSLRENKKSTGFNFRRDEFAVKRSLLGPGKDIRRVVLLIGVLLLLLLINTGVDYYYINKNHTMAEEIFNKEFDQKFPQQKGTKGTQLRLLIVQQKLKELDNPSAQISDGVRSDQKVIDVLKDISERVGEKYDFDVNNLTVRSNEVTISATTDNYPTVDTIANALRKSDLFKKVEIINPGQAKDRIKFDLKLVRTE